MTKGRASDKEDDRVGEWGGLATHLFLGDLYMPCAHDGLLIIHLI